MAAARTRVKICGVTTPTDARAAADAGADAVGINFHPPSPRSVGPLMAAEIAAALPPFVAAVGVFVDPDADRVRRILARVRLDGLQFSGNESAEFCRAFGLPYIKMGELRPISISRHSRLVIPMPRRSFSTPTTTIWQEAPGVRSTGLPGRTRIAA